MSQDIYHGKLLSEVRRACREVAARSALVRIDEEAIAPYAASLPKERLSLPTMDPTIHHLGHGADTIAFFLTLDAVNFGSGFFPEILGDTRRSGYRAVASALNSHFRVNGAIPADDLRRLQPGDCGEIFFPGNQTSAAWQLMQLFARALNDLGWFIGHRFAGDFSGVVAAAGNSAERLVELLTLMPLFDDEESYRGTEVPFYKRAQLTVVDLHIAFAGEGPGRFEDLERLTACADNLVPHVLRLDGILRYDDRLLARIEAGEAIPAGSAEEVEIRACSVHAVELIVEALRQQGTIADAMRVDNLLWHRGQEPLYRAHPRHRTKTAFY